jgi:uncharacterized protein YdaU (DUF1376 family)
MTAEKLHPGKWFPFYSSDFIGATVGLSCQERSIYCLMLPLYYEIGPFPVDRVRVYRIVGCESDEQKRTVDFLLERFFVLLEDGWYQERAEAEKVKMAQQHQAATDRGKRSAEARALKYGTAQPQTRNAFETLSKGTRNTPELTTTTTTEKEKNKDLRKLPLAHGFEKFWEAYPKKRSKAQAERAYRALKPDDALLDTLLAAIARARVTPDWCKDGGQFIPYPATWLNARGWEDDLVTQATGGEMPDWMRSGV